MIKKIFLIVPQSRENTPQITWKDVSPIYAVKTFKQALKDCKKHNDLTKSLRTKRDYLLFRYRIQIIDLFE